MSSPKPVLYIFAISHYCEKSRWALDHLEIDYDLRFLAPGEHRSVARKLGALQNSVPYLSADGQLVQGSASIIDWADRATRSFDKRLTPNGHLDECRRIEQRIDATAGVHVRRYYYSEALVEHPETVRPIFANKLSFSKKILLNIVWKKIQKLMIAGMDLGADQGQESRNIVAAELDWVDDMLSDGRSYLVGSQFSRADIAVASLLAPLVLPREHPTYKDMSHPPRMVKELSEWEQRPSIKWVCDIYSKHR